jgi:hypothetical protein
MPLRTLSNAASIRLAEASEAATCSGSFSGVAVEPTGEAGAFSVAEIADVVVSEEDVATETGAGVVRAGGLVSVGWGAIVTPLADRGLSCLSNSDGEGLLQAAAAPSRKANIKNATVHLKGRADDILILSTSFAISRY